MKQVITDLNNENGEVLREYPLPVRYVYEKY